jgi:hypothetical protein
MAISILLLIFSTAGSIYGSSNNEEENNRFVDLDNVNDGSNDKQKI